MRVYTVAGKVYAVSSDTGCDVIAAGVTLCHADAGVQTVFVAPSGEVTVTDDAAYVTGVDDGKVALGAAGGGRGTEAVQEQIDATIDTKLDDALNTDGDIEFVSQEATVNFNCYGVYLAGDLVPKGQLRSIAVPCRSNRGNMTANEVYLLVQETTGPNADFITVAVSTNAVRLIVGQTQVWQFNGEKLHGLRTRMRLVTDRDAGWDMATLEAAGYEMWGLRTSNRRADDTESGMFVSPKHPERNTAYVAEVHFTVTGRVVKYAEKTYVEEAADGLREEIRTALSAVLSYCGSVATEADLPSGDGVRKGDVYDVRESGANFVWTGEAWDDLGPMLDGYCKTEVFNGHVGDTVAHVNAAERGRWDKAAEDAGSALSAADAAQSTASAAQTAAEAAQGDATSALSAAHGADAKADAASTAAEDAKSEAASAKAAAEGAAAKDSFDAHVQNMTAHLSEEEHTGLTGLLASGGGGGTPGEKGDPGPYFTPSVSEDGVLSWSNNGELPNPESVNIKGADGAPGAQGPAGPAGPTGPAGQDAELTEEQTAALQFVQENQDGLQGLLEGGGGGGASLPEGNNFEQPVLGTGARSSDSKSVVLGLGAKAGGQSSTALGRFANAQGAESLAVGDGANAIGMFSIALGRSGIVKGEGSIGLGYDINNDFKNTFFAKVWGTNVILNLYFFGSDSELATNTEGEAGMGYMCGGKSGCIKLSDLLTLPFNLPKV